MAVDDLRRLLEVTAGLAGDFLESLPERPVYPRATLSELRHALGLPLPDEPTEDWTVVEELAAAVDGGLVAEPGGGTSVS
jgi:hypothetical protein